MVSGHAVGVEEIVNWDWGVVVAGVEFGRIYVVAAAELGRLRINYRAAQFQR